MNSNPLPIADSEEAKGRSVIQHEISRRRVNKLMYTFAGALLPSLVISALTLTGNNKSTDDTGLLFVKIFAASLVGYIATFKWVENHNSRLNELTNGNAKEFFSSANDPVLRNDAREQRLKDDKKSRQEEYLRKYGYRGELGQYYRAQLSRSLEASDWQFTHTVEHYLKGVPTRKLKAILKSGDPIFPQSNRNPMQRLQSQLMPVS